MNKGTLIGFISSDIRGEDIKLKSGETMRKIGFSIACNRKGKNAGADFPYVIAFGKTAETIEKYMQKGKGIIVEFHIQTSSYKNKDGKTIYQTDHVCDSFEFAPTRKSEEAEASNNAVTEDEPPKETPPTPEDFMAVSDEDIDDLPFRKK